MEEEAKNFGWPNIRQDIEERVNKCVACLASGKKLKYQITKNKSGILKPLTQPGKEIQVDVSGESTYKTIEREKNKY